MERTKVRVLCRLRPPLRVPASSASEHISNTTVTTNTVWHKHPETNKTNSFRFDHCYPSTAPQAEVYDGLDSLLRTVWKGLRVCVFAYGASGSGKTHKMMESKEDSGIIPRAMRDLLAFSTALEGGENKVTVTVSFFELLDTVRDLLVTSRAGEKAKDFKVERTPLGVGVAGFSERVVTTYDEFHRIYSAASARRATGTTQLNEKSSRSHAILRVTVRVGKPRASSTVSQGQLNLIDLAGSENNKRSGNTDHGNSTKVSKSTAHFMP